VDEAVRAIRDAVASAGALGNTYFLFVSDDGGHDGEHRLGGTVDTGWSLGGKAASSSCTRPISACRC
jgi:hypothetical protein